MTAEMLVWDGTQVQRSRGVRRTDEASRLCKGVISGITKYTWSADYIHPKAVFEDAPLVPAAEERPRGAHRTSELYVRRSDLETHGFTEGCRKCDAMRIGAQCNHAHTHRCRHRIIQAIGVDHPRNQRLVEQIVDLSGVPDPSDDTPGPLEAEDEPVGELLGESDGESSEDGGMDDA